MIDGAFALAFAAGMVATFNPCGFAMLPAYLAYFLGMEDESPDSRTAVIRAVKISAVLTLGFVVVFGLAGYALSAASGIQERLPWVTMVIGVALIALGIAFLFGYQLTVGLPKLNKGTNSRQLGSMFLFGVSYAVASLSCTIGPFLAVAGGLFGRGNNSLLSGALIFVVYGLGMGLVLSVLTIAIALAKQGIVTRMRGALKYVTRISGALLVVAGGYLIWYGYWETRIFNGDTTGGGPAEYFFDLNARFNNWINDVGATTVGLALVGFIAIVLLLTWGWWAMNKPLRDGADLHPASIPEGKSADGTKAAVGEPSSDEAQPVG